MDKAPGAVSHLRFPVVTAGSEYLVMGHLMRRNILTYKAPPNNEGYDLICIHPDPRHRPKAAQLPQVRVQVKSRYATDCDRKIPVGEASLSAFDFLVISLLNIGDFYRKRQRSGEENEPQFYTLPVAFVREHHHRTAGWKGELSLKKLTEHLPEYDGEAGFEQIARALGISRPARRQLVASEGG